MEEWTGKFSIIQFYLSVCARHTIEAFADEKLQLLDIGKPDTLTLAESWFMEQKEIL